MNTSKLTARASYDFQNSDTIGKVVEAKPHGLTETQRKIQEERGFVCIPKVGFDFTPPQPVRKLWATEGQEVGDSAHLC